MEAEKEIANNFPSFLRGGGEMGKLIRNYNWMETSFGATERWPQSFRTTLSILLHSKFPMVLFWGKEYCCFYNDAFHEGLGSNIIHSYAPGKKGIEVWPEIWKIIGPFIESTLVAEEADCVVDQLLPVYRNGKAEDAYWSFSSSPVFDESEQVAGVLVACMETTNTVDTRKQIEANKYGLNFALEIAELGTYKLDIATDVVTISERIMNWFGFKDPYISLNRLKSIVHPNDLYRTAKSLNDTTKSETVSRHDIQYTVIDPRTGGEKHMRSIGKAIFEDHVAISIEGVLQDITQQASIQKKIEQSEQRFRNLIRHATVGVIVLIGPEMVVDIVNEFYCRVIDKPYKELIRKPLFDVVPEMRGSLKKQINRVRVTGIPMYLYEQSFFRAKEEGKKEGYVNLVFQPLKERNDEISGVVILVHDVTEQVIARRKLEYAEQRARLAIDTAGLGVYEVNLLTDEIISDANFYRIYGFDHKVSRSELVANVHPDDLHIRNEAHHQSVSTGYLEYECRLLWKDKTLRWVHVGGKLFFDHDRIPVKLLGVVQDVTAQKLAEEELERKVAARTQALAEANHLLHKTNTELNQFAYVASHDLQEPLRKITTYTGMLEASLEAITTDNRNYLNKIVNSANRMKALIHDVLAYSQVSDTSNTFQPTDLNAILEDIREDYEILISQKAAVITSDPLPVIEALPLQMGQLFANLVSNALKFSKINISPQLNIRVLAITEEDRVMIPQYNPALKYCRIQFKDNGIGFSAEYSEKIFAIFQRLHSREVFAGTGIGLAICRKIVLNHNGYINAFSKSGDGAVFNVILPLSQSS